MSTTTALDTTSNPSKKRPRENKQTPNKKRKVSQTPSEPLGFDKQEELRLTQKLFGNLLSGGSLIDIDNESKPEDQGEDKKKPTEEKEAAWVDDEDEQWSDFTKESRKMYKERHAAGHGSWASVENLEKAQSELDDPFVAELYEKGVLNTESLIDGVDKSVLKSDLIQSKGYRSTVLSKKLYRQRYDFHPSGHFIAFADKHRIDIFSVKKEEFVPVRRLLLSQLKSSIANLKWTSDGLHIVFSLLKKPFLYVVSVSDGRVEVVSAHKALSNRPLDTQVLRYIEVCPRGKYIALVLNRYSEAYVIYQNTFQAVRALRAGAETITCMTFDPSGKFLYVAHKGGSIRVWDMDTFQMVQNAHDEGALEVTAMKLSPNGQFLATGSDMGVLNVYQLDGNGRVPVKPLAVKMNLSTQISTISWSHDAQVLVYASYQEPGAMRMIHVPSFRVFKWPRTQWAKSAKASKAVFTPKSDKLVITDATKPATYVWTLEHYVKAAQEESNA